MGMRERSAVAVLLGLALLLCRNGGFAAFLLLAGGAALAARRRVRPAGEVADEGYQPFVTLVIPAKDEAGVIAGAVAAALGQRYEPGCEVLAVDDGSRDGTRRVLRELQRRHPQLRILARAPDPGEGKGGALAAAMPLCRGELVALLDADARVGPDFLARMVPYLAPAGVGAVQSRKRVREPAASLLHQLQADEAAMIAGLQLDREAGAGAVDLMGNGMLIKRHALDDAGGWDARALTEDLDLGTRLHARNWEVRYAHGPLVWEEPALSWGGLFRQRLRWAEGSYRRFCRHFWALLAPNVPVGKKADMLCYLGALILPLGLVGSLALGALAGVSLELRPLALVAVLALAITPVQVGRALYRDGLRRPLPLLARSLLATIFMTAIWTPAVLVALARIVCSARPSAWVKTEHGGLSERVARSHRLEAPPCR